MDLYHASLNLWVLLRYVELFPDKRLNVLKSFGILNNEMMLFLKKHRDKINGLIFDSGTWTLNKAKNVDVKSLNLNTYKDYLLTFFHYFDWYFNFDSCFTDDGFEKNSFNQIMLEDSGLRPVPVIHNIYDDEISFYIDQGYTRIALGSSQIRTIDHMVHVMRRFEGTGVMLHLFGNASPQYIFNFPIYSCDTAMWAKTGGYGFIKYWNPKKDIDNKTDKIYLEEYYGGHGKDKSLIKFSDYEFKDDLETYWSDLFGLEYYDLIGHDGAYNKMLVNTHYYVELENAANRIHQAKGI